VERANCVPSLVAPSTLVSEGELFSEKDGKVVKSYQHLNDKLKVLFEHHSPVLLDSATAQKFNIFTTLQNLPTQMQNLTKIQNSSTKPYNNFTKQRNTLHNST
jgi:hypothetical protein